MVNILLCTPNYLNKRRRWPFVDLPKCLTGFRVKAITNACLVSLCVIWTCNRNHMTTKNILKKWWVTRSCINVMTAMFHGTTSRQCMNIMRWLTLSLWGPFDFISSLRCQFPGTSMRMHGSRLRDGIRLRNNSGFASHISGENAN